MKKISLLILISIASLNLKAQDATKQETIDWLNQKMKNYLKDGAWRTSDPGVGFEYYYAIIQGDYLKVSLRWKTEMGDHWGSEIWQVYLGNITSTSFCSDGTHSVDWCSGFSTEAFFLSCKSNSVNINSNDKRSNIYFPLVWSDESNLQNRFKKAFDHLLGFYSSQNKEKF